MYPLKEIIHVSEYGPPTVDRFGNEVPGKLMWVPKKVFGYAVVRTEEGRGDSVMRLIDELQLIAPPDLLGPEQKIRLPNGQVWTVEGNAEDYNTNPWFKPGLVIIHCRKVEG